MGTITRTATIEAGWIAGMTTLEIVAWLREKEYDGPVDMRRDRLVELMLEIMRPVDWSAPAEPEPAETTTEWSPHEVKANWVYMTEWEGLAAGGVDLQVDGEAGWFRFDRLTANLTSQNIWVDCYGGPKGNEAFRSFKADRVKRNRKTGRIVTRVHVNRKDKD
jgi:hypothetical protein